MTTHILDDAWDSAVGGLGWLKSVLFGEFSDNRPVSAVIADMLASFVPGVIIITSARDAVAVIVRLAQHPERREEPVEWMLLAACLITLALPLALAAGGLVVAGMGAVAGGFAGSELAATLRAVMLMLIKESSKLAETLRFLQKFMHGDILLFLRSIKFVKYEQLLLTAFNKIIEKLIEICKVLTRKLEYFPYFDEAKLAIVKLAAWEQKFYALQKDAIRQLPLGMRELDKRLAKLLTEVVPKESHVVVSGVTAPRPDAKPPQTQRVYDPVGTHLADGISGLGLNAVHEHGANKSVPRRGSAPMPSAIKEKPDKVDSVVEVHNTKRQDAAEPDVGGSSPPANAAAPKSYGVAFFGQDNKAYYTPSNPTIGRSGRPFFLMPLEDSGIVKNAGDAARYTGMAPSAQQAYVKGGPIYGLTFPLDGMAITKPTAADAMGWDHFLEGGNTAVKLGDGPMSGYLLNPTREFVIPGGNPVPQGSVLFELGENGDWIPIQRY